jgi:O-antigen/teichoic acid export membrane protein
VTRRPRRPKVSLKAAPIRRSDLADAAATGIKWTGLAGAITAAVAMLQTLVLARLLAPSDFGLIAATMVVVSVGQALADGGVSYALLRSKSDTREIRSSLYWLNIAAGTGVFVLVVAASPLVASFYGQPRVVELVRWAALMFLIAPWGLQFQILLQKELQFRTLATVQLAAAVAGAIVGISSAVFGAGALALVWGFLATAALPSIVYTIIGWHRWRPMRRFRRADLDGYVVFGLYQMGERVLNQLTASVDYVVIGYFLGPTSLGIYSLAYQLVVRPLVYLNPIIVRVAFPIFARKQDDDDALARGYLHVARIVAYISFPLLAGLAVTAPMLVPFVLGDIWSPLVPVLQVLCSVGAVRCVYNPAGVVVLAKGRADLAFRLNLAFFLIMIGALTAASQQGLQTVAWSEAAVVTAQGAVWWLLLRRVIGLAVRRSWASVQGPLFMALGSGLCASAVGEAFRSYGAHEGIAGAAVLVTMGAAYAGCAYAFDRGYVKSMVTLLRRS